MYNVHMSSAALILLMHLAMVTQGSRNAQEALLCYCPPGYKVVKKCDLQKRQKATCQRCDVGEYSGLHDEATSCALCPTKCTKLDQVLVHKCQWNTTNNDICQCKDFTHLPDLSANYCVDDPKFCSKSTEFLSVTEKNRKCASCPGGKTTDNQYATSCRISKVLRNNTDAALSNTTVKMPGAIFNTTVPNTDQNKGAVILSAVLVPVVIFIVVIFVVCHKRWRKNRKKSNQQDGHNEEGNMPGQEDKESSSSVIYKNGLGPMISPKSAATCTSPLLKRSESSGSGQGIASAQFGRTYDKGFNYSTYQKVASVLHPIATFTRDLYTSAGKIVEPVVIAIIDSGALLDHQVIEPVIEKYPHLIKDCVNVLVDTEHADRRNIKDRFWHGTAILSQYLKLWEGFYEMVSFVIIKAVHDDGTFSYEDLKKAFDILVPKKVDIVSISLGLTTRSHSKAVGGVLNMLQDKTIVFGAAPNVGDKYMNAHTFPGSHCICIGSHDAHFNRSSFSPKGQKLDFLVYGESFEVASLDAVLHKKSTYYELREGTSFAVPVAVSYTALVLQRLDVWPPEQDEDARFLHTTAGMLEFLKQNSQKEEHDAKTGFGALILEEKAFWKNSKHHFLAAVERSVKR